MEVIKAILSRRSIRRYSGKKIEKKIVDKIIHAGMYAPSAVNKQPWHFIVFEDKESCRAIAEVHPNAAMLNSAALGVLVCFDEKLQHDEGYGTLDCSAATQNMLLAAHDMGLGACWIGIYPRENRMQSLQRIFNLPDHIKAFSIVSLGYSDEDKPIPERFKPERIHLEKW